MASGSSSFRVGRVRAFLRGKSWYLCYYEHLRRRQPRIGPDRELARRTAAEINAQLEVGAPSALGFDPASIPEVRQRWLDNHEDVRRSSVQTIRRYQAATNHLVNFVSTEAPVRRISDFRPVHAEQFVRYLRSLQVAPNGHHNATKRRLRDSGVKYILETCCSLFNFARRHRHLSPYAENPFTLIEVGRMPVEDAKPIVVLDESLERRFFEACDDWQLPIFLTLLFTGLRPGELTHLLLPHDLDLKTGWLFVRNKPQLGWQVKTRTERDIPLVPVLANTLHKMIGSRSSGPVFRQRRYHQDDQPPLNGFCPDAMARHIDHVAKTLGEECEPTGQRRLSRQRAASMVWRRSGGLRTDWIRIEFMRLTAQLGVPEITAPKTLRHSFATLLQESNVDPLIRSELMGHSASCAGLGMTAVYTHSRPETKRTQLEVALHSRPAGNVARSWVEKV